MPDRKIDYDALAKKYGGTTVDNKGGIYYTELARQFGGTTLPETIKTPDPFEATAANKEGTYQMMAPDGTVLKNGVPFSKVMDASKAGYKISPDDRLRYGKDKLWTLRGYRGHEMPEVALADVISTRKQFNPDTDLPESYETVSATPKTPWYDPNWKGIERGALDLLPTAGGIAGKYIGETLGAGAGAVGGEVGGPVGGVAGALTGAVAAGTAGSAIGGAAGELARQQLSEILFPFDSRMTAKEKAKNIGEQGLVQGGLNLGGEIAAIPLSKTAKYFGKTAMESERSGIHLFPSEAHRTSASYLEKLAKGNIISKDSMERFRVEQNVESKLAVNKIANEISNFKGTPEELGKVIQSGIEDHKKAFRSLQNKVYNGIAQDVNERIVKVPVTTTEHVPTGILDKYGNPIYKSESTTTLHDEVVDDVMPSTKNLKVFARKALDRIEQQEKIMDPTLLSKSKSLLQTILNSPDRVPFNVIKDSRSDYLEISRQFDQALEGKAAGFAKKMSQLYDESMIEAAEKSKIPGLVDKIRSANKITSNEHEMFEMPLIKKIVDTKDPGVIAALIRRPNVGNQETRDLFTILPQKLHDPVRAQILEDTMKLSTDPNTQIFNERGFAQKIGKIGDERGEIIFGKNWHNIKELTRDFSWINAPDVIKSGSSASTFQNIATIKNILSLAGASLGATAGAFTGGPKDAGIGAVVGLSAGKGLGLLGEYVSYKILAKVLTNPELATKMLKAVRALVRYAPPVGGGGLYTAVDLSRKHDGKSSSALDKINKNTISEVKKKAEELKSKTGSSDAAPYTHVYHEPSGQIIPANP